MIYAQIDENNICFAVSNIGNAVIEKDTLIPLETYDTSYLGMKYNNGVWEEVPQEEEEVIPTPSQLDRIEEQVNTIVSGTTSENTEAINALLGV